MITIYEAERLFNLIKTKNNNSIILGNSYSYDSNKQVALNVPQKKYAGNTQSHFNILPRLIYKKQNKKAFEKFRRNSLHNSDISDLAILFYDEINHDTSLDAVNHSLFRIFQILINPLLKELARRARGINVICFSSFFT